MNKQSARQTRSTGALRLLELQEVILERARMLDVEVGQEHESEAQALEEAADFVRQMKLGTQADGLGKEVRVVTRNPSLGTPNCPKTPHLR
jgi:hypothetical protein